MPPRALITAAACLVLLCAACKPDSDAGSTGSTGAAPGDTSSTESTEGKSRYTAFDQVPGPVLTWAPMTEQGRGERLDVKAMTAAVQPEFQVDTPGPGKKFLVVYVAVTPADGPGFPKLNLQELNIRYPNASASTCSIEALAPQLVTGYCYRPSKPARYELVPLDSDWEHKDPWIPNTLNTPVEMGKGYASVGTFPIPDTVTGPFELCGTGAKVTQEGPEPPGPCVPLNLTAQG
ncbi:hypothetical protein [Amycolatopsis sp. CA-230715]|uniref:hypothetical protein n=1 Tax=Amycolatopsis sp. CA-230715 TaxID=2745196 RepID=UPI001C0362AD|nr:hypothetical protein [Amycolatopsis sp. CA-230715]QWF77091.1 hypothetical protein HUW46_00471 [Amycolatopsis sp. CA-230715]